MGDVPAGDAHDAARVLTSHLQEGEELLWAARPDARRYGRVRPWLLVFGVLWLTIAGFAFAGFTVALLDDEFSGVAFPIRVGLLVLTGAPFLAVGTFAVGGHVPAARRLRRRIAYGLTNWRLLVVRPAYHVVGPPRLRALPRERVTDVVVEPASGDVGSIEVHDRDGREPPLDLVDVAGAEAVAEQMRGGPRQPLDTPG